MASRLLQQLVEEMSAMRYTMVGDETVRAMDAVKIKAELLALDRLRSRCESAHDTILQSGDLGHMAYDQAVRLNEQMVITFRRGDEALRRQSEAVTIVPAPDYIHADNTAQMLQALRKREPTVGQFTGEPQLWPAFRDLFILEVHNRDNLEPVTKLTFLKNACIGKAQSALGLWSHTNESYDGAWALMQKRYDDSYKITQGLVNMLFALPAATAETHDGLSQLVDTIQSVLRQLINARIDVASWDVWLRALVINRLPIATVDAWEQHRGSDHNPSLESMLEFIAARARGRMYHEQSTAYAVPKVAIPTPSVKTELKRSPETGYERPPKRQRDENIERAHNKHNNSEPVWNDPQSNRSDINPSRNDDRGNHKEYDQISRKPQTTCYANRITGSRVLGGTRATTE